MLAGICLRLKKGVKKGVTHPSRFRAVQWPERQREDLLFIAA